MRTSKFSVLMTIIVLSFRRFSQHRSEHSAVGESKFGSSVKEDLEGSFSCLWVIMLCFSIAFHFKLESNEDTGGNLHLLVCHPIFSHAWKLRQRFTFIAGESKAKNSITGSSLSFLCSVFFSASWLAGE